MFSTDEEFELSKENIENSLIQDDHDDDNEENHFPLMILRILRKNIPKCISITIYLMIDN